MNSLKEYLEKLNIEINHRQEEQFVQYMNLLVAPKIRGAALPLERKNEPYCYYRKGTGFHKAFCRQFNSSYVLWL